MSPKKIKNRYAKRITAILHRIASTLRDEGYLVEGPEFIDGDDYRWSLLVRLGDDTETLSEDDIDITFTICESEQFDGTPGGINFSLSIVEVGGRIVGGLTPFNYSDQCWVSRNDAEAIEERFHILEQADEGDIASLLERHQMC